MQLSNKKEAILITHKLLASSLCIRNVVVTRHHAPHPLRMMQNSLKFQLKQTIATIAKTLSYLPLLLLMLCFIKERDKKGVFFNFRSTVPFFLQPVRKSKRDDMFQ